MLSFQKTLKYLLLFLSLPCPVLFSQDSLFARGEEFFLNNRPTEAISILEEAITLDPTHSLSYLYLGIAYQQLGDNEQAISVFVNALLSTTQNHDKFFYNLGNNYFILGRDPEADEAYTQAIVRNDSMAEAFLNRGVTRIRMMNYQGASEDFTRYLSVYPESEQAPELRQVLFLLQSYEFDQRMELLTQPPTEEFQADPEVNQTEAVTATTEIASESEEEQPLDSPLDTTADSPDSAQDSVMSDYEQTNESVQSEPGVDAESVSLENPLADNSEPESEPGVQPGTEEN